MTALIVVLVLIIISPFVALLFGISMSRRRQAIRNGEY